MCIPSFQGNCSGTHSIIQTLSPSMATTFLDPRLYNSSLFSFVPFCAFKGKLSPCSSFSSILIDGNLCHTVSINASVLEPGPKNGFLLVLDPMMSTPLDLDIEKGDVNSSEDREVLSKGPQFQNLAKLHLATLSPYTSIKNGTHILNALKVVTGSESFLAQSEERKGCGNEEFEVCQSRRYLVAVEQQCGCVPWLATFFLEHEVIASDLQSSFYCVSNSFLYNFTLHLKHPKN